MKTSKKIYESVCIGCKKVLGVALSCVWFGLVLRNFCIKEIVRFQRSCCQMFFKNPVLVLTIG